MRKINGFVCIARMRLAGYCLQEILFGVNVNLKQGISENFRSNGLVPFPNLQAARKGREELIARRMFKEVQIARITMHVTETVNEILSFAAQKNLIVIAIEEYKTVKEMRLMGRYVKGKPGQGPIPGARLEFNGCKPFLNFRSAENVASEAKRQMDCRVLMATFELERLKQ